MIFFWALFIFVCGFNAKFAGINKLHYDYISQQNTTAINGIFTFFIVMGHFVQYMDNYGSFDQPYIEIRKFLGQMVVATFFTYSGYGIFESYKKKGTAYIMAFPKNRMLKLLLHLDIAVVIYAVLFLILDKKFTVQQFGLSLVGWEYIGNNNWFIFATLVFYIFTFLTFVIIKKDKFIALCTITALTLAYIIVIREFKDTYWYNSTLCFPMGMWYSYFKNIIEKIVMKNSLTYYSVLGIAIASFVTVKYVLGGFSMLKTYLLCCAFFAVCIILISMKIKFSNPILDWLGKHSFSIYMLQRIPMIVLDKTGFLGKNPEISFVISIAITFILSELFDRFTNFADSKIFKQKT